MNRLSAHGSAGPQRAAANPPTPTMTSDRIDVWTWRPYREEPVVAGALAQVGDRLHFDHRRSYLDRPA